MNPRAVIERRLAERAQMIEAARAFVSAQTLPVKAAVVFGSVARGDFNDHSDVDVLIVADVEGLDYWGRQQRLVGIPARIQPVVWSAEEWRRQRARGNSMAVDAERDGVWLIGEAEDL